MTNNEVYKLFAKNVAKYRKLKKISIKELSEKTNISVKFLERIENATAKRINTNHAFLIADGLNIKPYKLFDE